VIIDAGKTGFGQAMPQADIDALIVEHALDGAHVVRLKAGDPTVFGRLDEEIEAITAAGISYQVIPGITAASAAVANIGQSLTKRGRNSSVRLITGHDTRGYANHDWLALAADGEVAAIYMGKKSARFIQGRLLMHGANPDTPVTIIENVSRPDQRIIACTLGTLEPTMSDANLTGPALTFLGLAPRDAAANIPATFTQQEAL
jgi:uroporphyrin-III C-methyltransferase/precorrin-2 dehydrogenase/sirohydrochlorin ferrochelatase